MAIITVGPEFAIDGPLPVKPRFTLVDSTLIERATPDVTEATDGERWANGITVHSYPNEIGSGWAICGDYSQEDEKVGQVNPIALPSFGPMTIYITEQCSSPYIRGPEDFRKRALVAFTAVESAAVAREFENGFAYPDNPYLADSNMTDLNSGGAVSPAEGLALLEDAIAATNKAGVIHIMPGMLAFLTTSGGGGVFQQAGGKLYTINGTLVIPDAGYEGRGPSGNAPAVSQGYAYATGPVETLRSDPIIIPDTISEALDRSNNTVTYRAERYYIPFWDTTLQAGVLMDRCLTECGTT